MKWTSLGQTLTDPPNPLFPSPAAVRGPRSKPVQTCTCTVKFWSTRCEREVMRPTSASSCVEGICLLCLLLFLQPHGTYRHEMNPNFKRVKEDNIQSHRSHRKELSVLGQAAHQSGHCIWGFLLHDLSPYPTNKSLCATREEVETFGNEQKEAHVRSQKGK